MSSTDTSSTKLSDHPLLERTRHLDELGVYLRDAGDGRGSVVFIGGNAGIGKTALVREFAGQAANQGSRVLIGACDPLSTREPLAPLFDILDEAPAETRDRLRNADSRITRLGVPDAPPRPCLAIFEDVHWADEATLDLLRYVGRRIRETHALLVATYRNDEVGSDHPLRIVLGDVASLGTSHRMRVPALSESAVGILAEGSTLTRTSQPPALTRQPVLQPAEIPSPRIRRAFPQPSATLSWPGHRASLTADARPRRRGRHRLTGEIWLVTGIFWSAAQSAIDECIEAGCSRLTGSPTGSGTRSPARQSSNRSPQAIFPSCTPRRSAGIVADQPLQAGPAGSPCRSKRP
ncbi:MAG: AAA family ATPase [Thermomicrobiales bacterium]